MLQVLFLCPKDPSSQQTLPDFTTIDTEHETCAPVQPNYGNNSESVGKAVANSLLSLLEHLLGSKLIASSIGKTIY